MILDFFEKIFEILLVVAIVVDAYNLIKIIYNKVTGTKTDDDYNYDYDYDYDYDF